jgi:hypothetical protein
MPMRQDEFWCRFLHVSPCTDVPTVCALFVFVTTPETQKKKAPRDEKEIRDISARIPQDCHVPLVGIVGLQEDMVGSSQSGLECLKILLPEMYVGNLVSSHFLCAKSDLLGFAIGTCVSMWLN